MMCRCDSLLRTCAYLLLLAPVWAHATEIRGRAATYLGARESVRNGESIDAIPVYEHLSLEVSKLDIPGLQDSRLMLRGWGRLQLGDDTLRDSGGDLALLFFETTLHHVKVRLGRQHLLHGVGRMSMIDGVDINATLPLGFGIEAFAGAEVHPQLRFRSDTWQSGGRFSWRLPAPQQGEVGVSHRQHKRRGEIVRNELGVDAFYMFGPTRTLMVGAIDADTHELIEARLATSWFANDAITATLDLERTAPSLWLRRDSIFSVFADAEHDAAGGDIHWAPSPYYSVSLVGHALWLDAGWLGYRASLRGVTYREASHRSQVGFDLRRLYEGDSGYSRMRVFTTLGISESLSFSADVHAYQFDAAVNGQDQSVVAQASAIYDISGAWRMAATGVTGSTAYARSQVEGMLRIIYGYDYGYDVALVREVGP